RSEIAIDEGKLREFVGKAMGDMGAAMGAALVVIGDKLGLYKAMAGAGPLASAELAKRTGCAERYVREWLAAQAAGGHGTEGVAAKLESGARVADVGCGHGASTILLAAAYPGSTYVGFDYHEPSISWARKAASRAGVADRVRFEVASSKAYPGKGYDLVAFFDCLHDMGDPVGAAKHVLSTLDRDGTWMIVEPFAGDRVEQNLNPVGRVYYAASTMVCTPASLAQEVGLALGAQAGE